MGSRSDYECATPAYSWTSCRRKQDALQMASISRKENSRRKREKVRRVTDKEPIVGVPAVAVAEPVEVRVPIAPIAVDVTNRDASCVAPSISPAKATAS